MIEIAAIKHSFLFEMLCIHDNRRNWAPNIVDRPQVICPHDNNGGVLPPPKFIFAGLCPPSFTFGGGEVAPIAPTGSAAIVISEKIITKSN